MEGFMVYIWDMAIWWYIYDVIIELNEESYRTGSGSLFDGSFQDCQ